MPYDAWCCLMAPVVEAEAGGDWVCNSNKEVFTVTEAGLGQLDYLFGVTIPSSYNWKERTWAFHSRTKIAEITFTFDLAKHALKLQSRQEYPR